VLGQHRSPVRAAGITLTGLDPTIHRTSMVPDMETSGVAERDARVERSMIRSGVFRGLTALVFVP
jgi:hypothetical protein